MMKKMLLTLVVVLLSVLCMVSCDLDDVTDMFGTDEEDPKHTHEYEAEVFAPTCTKGGYTEYICECGDSYTDDLTDPAHKYSAEVTDPTCTEEGYTTYTCEECGDRYTDDLTDPAHKYSAEVTDPTCTEEGYTTYTCEECGDSYTDDLTDPAHKYSAEVTDPTCTEEGYTTYTCEKCGHSYTESIEPTGHKYAEEIITPMTCYQNAVVEYKCDCGHSYRETMETKGHDYESETTPSGCTEDGRTVYTCSVCHYSYEEIVKAAHKVGADGRCTVCSRAIWSGDADTSWFNATDSEFVITTPAALAGLADIVNGGNSLEGVTVKLGADIDFGDRELTPIGTESAPFAGVFSGEGHAVASYLISEVPERGHIGLFGYVTGTVSMVSVRDFRININSSKMTQGTFAKLFVGAIAGYNAGRVDTCSSDGRITVTTPENVISGYALLYIGGIVGYNDATVDLCYSTDHLNVSYYLKSGAMYVGGVNGYNSENGTVLYSSASSAISTDAGVSRYGYADNRVGALIGYSAGTVNSSSATANITANISGTSSYGCDNYVGGLIGYIVGGTVSECFSDGSVTANSLTYGNASCCGYVGGFFGYSEGGTLTKCASTVSVTAESTTDATGYSALVYVGGFAGLSYSAIDSSYATGQVVGRARSSGSAGGFVGFNHNDAVIRNCYASGDVSMNGEGSESHAGGFVGENYYATVENCYAAGDVECVSGSLAFAGGLAGDNYYATVRYSFAIGNVTVNGARATSTSSTAGTIIGEQSNGTVTRSYYSSSQILSSNCNSTALFGTNTSASSFTAASFITETLGWSADVWTLADGELPTLDIGEKR